MKGRGGNMEEHERKEDNMQDHERGEGMQEFESEYRSARRNMS